MAFEDSNNKLIIRNQWNTPLIAQWAKRFSMNRLSYFGLSGPEILDLRDWRDFLSIKTVVESPGKTIEQRAKAEEVMRRMTSNVNIYDLYRGFQLLISDIEDLILQGFDINGSIPKCGSMEKDKTIEFFYDLYNLDFDGGLGFSPQNGGKHKRVECVKEIFRKQKKAVFYPSAYLQC